MQTLPAHPTCRGRRLGPHLVAALWAAASVFMLACSERSADRPSAMMEDMEGPMAATTVMPGMDMLPSTRAYLDSLNRAPPGDLPEFVGGHRARVEPMLTAMGEDMRAVRMSADAAWTGLTDSVRADLAAIPGLSGENLLLRLRAHVGRMRRLLSMHEGMMGMMR